MDFLDPKARKQHAIRLTIGYILMAVLIGISTYILVLRAYGFDVDRKTGQVIQNGLVFIDSAPNDATILLNGTERKEKTNSRIALPEGSYNLEIRKDGYRNWQRSFDLRGGQVERFTYPLLVPNNLERQEIDSLDTAPILNTESPDRRWVLVSQGASLTNFTLYDLNALTNKRPDEQQLTFSNNLFSPAEGPHTLEAIEWSEDNQHVLVKHGFGISFEFVVLSRETPNTAININRLLGLNPTSVVLRDKKFDQWYLYTAEEGVLRVADGSRKQVADVANGVGIFKSHDAETLLYTQPIPNSTVQRVILRQDGKVYTLREIPAGLAVLDIARYDGAWHIVIASDADMRTYVYRNPVEALSKNSTLTVAPATVLRHAGPLTYAGFSQNTRFIVAQSGQHFETYDAEYKEHANYDLAPVLDAGSKVVWMDGHRMLARSQNKLMIFDFDGSNLQELLPSLTSAPAMFDRDYTNMYTLDKASANEPRISLFQTSLRLEEDR